MGKTTESFKVNAYRTGEVIFLLLTGIYFTGGLLLIPDAWITFFDSHPKVHRKLLAYIAGVAVILGLILFEWARRDRVLGSRSVLTRIVETWKTSTTLWITGLFFVFGAWWTASSCLRYGSMNSGFDMAIFTQAVWNTAQGDWFYSSIKGGINLLGDHFAPILALIAIPYKFWPDPNLLLGIQAFSVAACVFPLSRIVRKSGQSSRWAVLFCITFMLYLPVRNAIRFEFHPEVVAMPLLFWAFAFLEERRGFLASLFLVLALLAKENMATVAFAFGVYAVLTGGENSVPAKTFCSTPGLGCDNRQIKNRVLLTTVQLWGIGWMVFSVFYFFVVTSIVIPKFSGAPYAYLDGNFISWMQAGWGPFAQHILRPDTFEYIAKIYGPLAFTGILAPASFLLTLPALAQNLLSRNEMTRSIFFQYTATLTPFVFISSAMALAKIRSYRRYWAYLLLLTSVLMSGVSEIYPMRRHWIQITPHTKRVAEILRTIPTEYSVRTHERYATHAANRKELHVYENNHPKEGGSWKARHTDLVAIDRKLLEDRFDASLVDLERADFQVEREKDGFVLLKNSALRGKKILTPTTTPEIER